MAQPPVYNRQEDFVSVQTAAPATPLPAGSVDAELNAIKATLDAVLTNIALIQRDDGALANQSVGPDQISPAALFGLSSVTDWQAGVTYAQNDGVFYGGKFLYRCLIGHTAAADIATDIAAGRWSTLIDFSAPVDGAAASAAAALVSEGAASGSAAAALASENAAGVSETNAAASEAAAAASAASINTPAIVAGDAKKLIRVNAAGDGYDLTSVLSDFMATVLPAVTADAAQGALGGTTIGKALFVAVSEAAARSAIGFDSSLRDRYGFAVAAQGPATLSVDVAAGAFFDGASGQIVSNAATNAGPIVAPAANPRSDIVYVDRRTGVPGIATGAESATPADPVLPVAALPLARINAYVGMTEIVTADIDDIRGLDNIGQTGRVLQIVSFETGAYTTGSTQIPRDNTTPQNTEGDQYMQLAITPRSANSRLRIDVTVHCDVNTALGELIAALFQDAQVNALASAFSGRNAGSGSLCQINFSHDMASPGVAATTFKVRAGPAVSSFTFHFNGQAGVGALFNGTLASSIVITEYI